MRASTGVITAEEAEQLVVGVEQVRSEAAAGQFNPGLDDEDVHFAVERRLIAILGPLGKSCTPAARAPIRWAPTCASG